MSQGGWVKARWQGGTLSWRANAKKEERPTVRSLYLQCNFEGTVLEKVWFHVND